MDLPRRAPSGPADRFPARGGAGTRNTSGSGAICARRRDRGRDRCGGLLHLPRRSHRHRRTRRRVRASSGTTSLPPIRAPSRATSRPPSHTIATSSAALRAQWARAISIDGVPTPTFGTSVVKGSMSLVVLQGHAPRSRRRDRLRARHAARAEAAASATASLSARAGRTVRVVGTALLPGDVAHRLRPQRVDDRRPASAPRWAPTRHRDITDYVLLRWRTACPAPRPRNDSHDLADEQSVFALPAQLPTAVVELGKLRSLPIALAIFFALLAIATVGHALVTTVRRRRYDLAILRSIGFTRRQARIAITWQATLLTIVGLVGRDPARHRLRAPHLAMARRQLPGRLRAAARAGRDAHRHPDRDRARVRAGRAPAHAATRIRPAQALRTE